MEKDAEKSELFSERMARLMLQYQNVQVTNMEVIAQLMQIVEDMKQASAAGAIMGLNAEELAFYDALSTSEGVREAFGIEKFIKMTHELADMIWKSKTIDWQLKDSVRARMRSMIKRLLKKLKYPPEVREKAIEMVIKLAEHMADMM